MKQIIQCRPFVKQRITTSKNIKHIILESNIYLETNKSFVFLYFSKAIIINN